MKKILTASVTLFSVSLFAYVNTDVLISDRAVTKPTQYTCVGPKNTRVVYTTTSFAGRPTFSTVFSGMPISFNAQSQIKVSRTIIGNLVGADFTPANSADIPATFYGVIIPDINLRSTQDRVTFETQAVQTILLTTGHVMHPFYGAAQANSFVPVKCTAEFVVF